MSCGRTTRCLTLASLLCALSAVMLIVGAYTDMLSLTVAAASSLVTVLVYIELGSPYTWLVWLATSLLTAIFSFASPVWVQYLLIFGIYPIIKGYLERMPRLLWLPVKFLLFNVYFFALFFIEEFIFGIPFFEVDAIWLKAATYALSLVAFFVYDYFIAYMASIYLSHFHEKVQRYLNR